MKDWYEDAKELAENHVDWFLKIIRPLLIEHMIHGYKHGKDAEKDNNLDIK